MLYDNCFSCLLRIIQGINTNTSQSHVREYPQNALKCVLKCLVWFILEITLKSIQTAYTAK